MKRKIGLSVAALFAVLLLLLAAAYHQRDRLVRLAVNGVLAEGSAELTELQGLRPGLRGIRAERLVVDMPEAGLRLVLRDVELRYQLAGFAMPVLQTLRTGSAALVQLSPAQLSQIQLSNPAPATVPDTATLGEGDARAEPGASNDTTSLAAGSAPSDQNLATLFQLIHNFPLHGLEISQLELPQWPQPLNLQIKREGDALQVELNSIGAALHITFSPPTPSTPPSPAQLPACSAVDPLLCSSAFAVSATVDGIPLGSDALHLGATALSASGTFAMQAEQWALQIDPGLALSLAALRAGNNTWELATVELHNQGSLAISLNPQTKALQLQTAELGGSIGALRFGDYQLSRGTQLSRGAQLSSDAQLSSGAMSAGTPALSFSGSLAMGMQADQWALQIEPGLSLSLGALQAGDSWQVSTLELHSEGALTANLDPQTNALQLQAAQLGASLGELRFGEYQLRGGSDATPAETTALSVSGSLAMSMQADQWALQIEPGLALSLAALQGGDSWAIAALELDSQDALAISLDPLTSTLQFEAAQLNGSIGDLRYAEYQLSTGFHLEDIHLGQDTALSADLSFETSALRISGLPDWAPGFDIGGSLALAQDQLNFSLPLTLRELPADSGPVLLEGSHDLASGRGHMQVRLPELHLAGPERPLSAWLQAGLKEWPYTADVLTGELSLNATVDWQLAASGNDASSYSARLQGSLKELAGYYETLYFRGLSTEFSATFDPAADFPLSTPPLSITLEALDSGVPLSNISAMLQVEGESQSLHVESLYAEVLGGSIGAHQQRYVFGSDNNSMNLTFTGLQLERLLQLAEYDGISARGAVSGEIPLRFSAAGVEVEDGVLFSEAPGGSIRYLGSGEEDTGNSSLGIVNRALRNYQFDSLESTIEYSPDGELLLGMKLQGYNPDMGAEQRINLNLNLSDNVPTLLESLQAGRAIQDFLQEQFE